VISVVLIAVIFVMSYIAGAPLDERADPATLTYVPTPEWFYLPLDQMLLLYPSGYLILVGGLGLVGIGALMLTLLPFLDRSHARAPLRRPEVIIPGLFLALVVVILAVLGANRLFNL
jgi:quinol-cytochrome oxidoreductase complex cytochrome b subunit